MNFVILLITAAVSVALGWFTYPTFHRALEERRERQAAPEAAAAAPEPENAPAPPAAAETASANGNRASTAFENVRGPSPEKPAVTASAPPREEAAAPAPSPPAEPEDPIAARYPLPVFKPIEEITQDWAMVPARAFPRTVRLKTPVTFETASGKTVLAAGAEALAVGMTRGFLVLMRSRNDSARAMAPLANTDLRETLTELYERYKESKVAQVMKQRERARMLQSRPVRETASGAGPKPEQQDDGVIPLMLASLKRGDIREVTPEAITQWGTLQIEEIDGEPCWTGTLQCTVENPIFGPTPTEVMAVIRNGRIVKWLYTGSREPVQ